MYYDENSKEVISQIKSMPIWKKHQIKNWKKIVNHISVDALPPLRYVMRNNILVLQQLYNCIIYFTEKQSFGSYVGIDKKYIKIWLDVPLEQETVFE